MKYLSVIIFAAIMSWTWVIIHSNSESTLETHFGIQEKLAKLITELVKNHKPQATDITIEKIWTEALSNNDDSKVKAHFTYKFTEPLDEGGTTQTEITGESLLTKQPSENTTEQKWSLSDIKSSNHTVTFDEATIITKSPSD